MSALPACVCAPLPASPNEVTENYTLLGQAIALLQKRVEKLCDDRRGRIKTFFRASLPNSLSFVALYNALCANRPDLTGCITCRGFYASYGTVVMINDDLSLTSLLWDASIIPKQNPYRPLVAALQAAIESPDNDIVSAFVWPTNPTGVKSKSKPGFPHWTSMCPPVTARYDDDSTLVSSEGFIANLGEARQGLERTIYKSYTADILARGLALVDSSDELGSITLALFPQASFLHKTMTAVTKHWPQSAYDADSTACPVLANRALWLATAFAAPGWCFPASNLIDKVYSHLANGSSVDVIKRVLDKLTTSAKYRRPRTNASAGEIAEAERAFDKLGLERAMARRVAAVADVSKAGWASWVAPLAPIAEWEKDRKTPELREATAVAKDDQAPCQTPGDAMITSNTAESEKKKNKSKSSLFSVCHNSDANKSKSTDAERVVGYHELVTKILPTATAMWIKAPERWDYGSMTTQTKYNAPPIMQWDVTAAVYKSVNEAIKAEAEEAEALAEAEAKAPTAAETAAESATAAVPEAVPEEEIQEQKLEKSTSAAPDVASGATPDEADASDKEDDEDYAAAKAAASATVEPLVEDAKSSAVEHADNSTDEDEDESEDSDEDESDDGDEDKEDLIDPSNDDDVDVDAFGGRDCECRYTHASDCKHPTATFDRDTARNPFDYYIYTKKSTASRFSLSLTPTPWHPCTSVLRRPEHFRSATDHSHSTQTMMITIVGASDTRTSTLGLFPSSIRSDLHSVRRVIEEYSDKTELTPVPTRFAGREASGVVMWKESESEPTVTVRVQDQDGSVKQYTVKFTGYGPLSKKNSKN